MSEYTREKYIELFGLELMDKYNVDAGDVWDNYHSRVEYALSIIPNYRIGDLKATEKQLRIGLGVKSTEWKAMKETFDMLKEALASDKTDMAFKADLDLLKGVTATEHKNAKMIEMMQIRFNPEYKPKGKDIEVTMPKGITVEYIDASIEEDDLVDKFDATFKK